MFQGDGSTTCIEKVVLIYLIQKSLMNSVVSTGLGLFCNLEITWHQLLSVKRGPIDFDVLNPCKYFQNLIKYIGIDIAINSFVLVDLKNELMAISIPMYFIRFWKYLHGFRTSKSMGPLLTVDTKQLVSSYFQITKKPQAGWNNTTNEQV